MTDHTDPNMREAFEAECDALLPNGDTPLAEGFALKAGPGAAPIFEFRYAEYAHLVTEWDVPESEKEARLEEFWLLMVKLGCLGYGFHPVDDALARKKQAETSCEQQLEREENTAPEGQDMV